MVDSGERENKDISAHKRDTRMPTYSTIGFYNKPSGLEKKSKAV